MAQASPRAPSGGELPAPTLSFWLQLMLAEIAAKREAQERGRAEEARRLLERAATDGGAARSL